MSEELPIHDKLNKITDVLTEIQISQARTEVNMAEHMRRTQLNEENMALIREELIPIKEHVTQVRTTGRILMWVIAAAGSIGTAFTAFVKYFR